MLEAIRGGHTVPRGAPGAQQPGRMKIVDGGVVYETPTSKGTMTFHETDAAGCGSGRARPRTAAPCERADEVQVIAVIPGGS